MSNPFISMIEAFSFNFAPRGWALCAGQTLPINQYQALFSLLGSPLAAMAKPRSICPTCAVDWLRARGGLVVV